MSADASGSIAESPMSGNGDESQVTAPGRKRGSRRKGKAAVEAVGVETEASAGDAQHIATLDAWTVFNRAMTGCAVVEKDRPHVFVEGDRTRDSRLGTRDSRIAIRGSGFGIRGALLGRALAGDE